MRPHIELRQSRAGKPAFPAPLFLALCLAALSGLGLGSCATGKSEPAAPAPAPVQAEVKKPDLAALIAAKDSAGIKDFYKNRELLDTPDAEGYYPLHRAVQQDSADVVDLLAALGAKVEAVDAKGRTPLRLAVDEGKAGPARVLADRGASIFAKDAEGHSAAEAALAKGSAIFTAIFNAKTVNQKAEDGTTILHLAADALLEESVKKLVDLGADTGTRNQAGRLPVDMALLHPDRTESARIAEFLIQRGPSPSFSEFTWFAQAARAMNYSTLRYDDGNTPLHEAVAARQRGFVDFLLSRKANPNSRNSAGSAPLHEAVRSGWLEGTELLLKGGADPNVRDGFDNTPLHIALPEEARDKCVDLLLAYKADPSLKDRNGNIPLHIAVQVGYSVSLVDHLLAAGSPVNAANAAGDTALHVALRVGKLEYCPSLLAKGADIFLANGKGETPLSVAFGLASANPGDGCAALGSIITPANVGSRDNVGNTPLHLAVGYQAPAEAISLIAARGGDANARNNAGDTALHFAVRKNQRIQGEALLAARADIFASNVKGETPLSIALTAPGGPIDWLFNSQTIAARDAYGDTPLHHAARLNLPQSIDFLAQKGGNVNAKNADGASPLAAAVKANSAAAARALLKAGADLNSRDAMGDTALHVAVLWSSRDCLADLVAAGADPDARNLSGESPLHQAAKKRDLQTMRFLLDHGASIQARDNRGATPLFTAAKTGSIDVAKALVGSGAELDARDIDGRTPLAAAVDSGEQETTKYLVASGASILARDAAGDSPLSLAAKRGTGAIDIVLTSANANSADADGKAALRALVELKPAPEAVDLAVARGAVIDARDANSDTALHAALRTGNLAVAAKLAAAGSDLFSKNRNGETPMSLAILAGPEALKAIIGGTRIKVLDSLGASPLHYAAQLGKAEAVDWLIAAGVDKNQRNILGESAADIAEKRGYAEIAAKLK
jgi:ankyrin repeat protein